MFRGFSFLLLILIILIAAENRFGQNFTVNTTADTPAWDDPNTPDINEADDGICQDQFGKCSLRAALMETSGGVLFPRTITLGVSGTINLTMQAPLYLYDGFKLIGRPDAIIKQPQEYQAVLGSLGSDIEVQKVRMESTTGSGLAIMTGSNIYIHECEFVNSGLHGLTIGGGQNIRIENNVLSGNQVAGMQISGFSISGLQIKRNKIGTNAAGTQANGNGMAGISIPVSIFPIPGIVIGGDSPSDRNIISGNSNYGIQLLMDGVTVKNNYIGTTINGTAKLPNANAGITINSSNNIITRNVISGNSLYGIFLHSGGTISPQNNLIAGNIIGGKATDTSALGNGIGINISGTSANNIIGSGLSQMNEANTIVYNAASGIIIANSSGGPPSRMTFRKNIFHDNTIKAIEVKPTTQGGIGIPVLDSLSTDATNKTYLYGHAASPGAVVDLYKGVTNASGFSEGKTWSNQVNADGAGNFIFDVSSFGCDEMVVMQTDPQGNSSEFSNSMNPLPSSISCTPACNGPYIAGISYSNEFTLKMNWRGMPNANRRVTFSINGANEMDGTLSGDEVKVTYDMALLHNGNNTLGWKIYKCDGSTLPGPGITLCATERPFWLLLPITASCNGGSVQYESEISFPATILYNQQNVPPDVDFIAGVLKFFSRPEYSVKLKVPGQSPTLEFSTAFDILGFSMSLRASGHANLNHTCGSIFPSGTAGLTGKFSHTFYAGYNLESLLPSCTGVLGWPIIKDGCEKVHSIARRLRVGAKVGGKLSLSATIVLNNGFTLSAGSAALGLYVKPFLDIFFIHARGTGRIDLAVDLPSFSLTNFSGSLRGKVYCDFPLLEFEKQLGPWAFSPDNPRPDSYQYETVPAIAWNEMTDQTMFPLADSLTVPNIPTDAETGISAGTGEYKAAVWNSFFTTAARPSGDIKLKIFNGSAWGSDIALTNDPQIDRSSTIAFDASNKIIVCWERNTSPSIPSGGDVYDPRFLKKSEIYYSVINPASGTVTHTGSFTDTSTYDAKPRLVKARNGSVLLTWQQTDGTTEFGRTGSPMTLKCTRWNGNSWGAVNTISNSLTGVMSWETASYDTAKAMVALVRDTDDQLGTTGDLEVYYLPQSAGVWQQPVRVTTDNAVDWGVHAAYTNTGKPVLTWLRDSSLVGVIDNLTAAPQLWYDSLFHNVDFIDGKISCVNDTLVALWSEAGAVYYSYANVSVRKWSEPQAISITENIQRSVSVDNSNGKLTLGYLDFPYADSIPPLSTHGKIYVSSVALTQQTTEIKDEGSIEPRYYHLFETYPNPFNNSMTVEFSVARESRIAIRVFDLLGREIGTLTNSVYSPGVHRVFFTANDYPSGVYFVHFTNGTEQLVKKVILSK